MLSRQLLIFAAIGVTLVTLLNSVFIVDQQHARVLLTANGDIKSVDVAPGLHLKWPYVESVVAFDSRILTIDNQTESFVTQEKKTLKADYFIKWRIADTLRYSNALNGDESVAGDRLTALVDQGLRDEFGTRTIQQVIAAGDALTTAVARSAKDKAAGLGLEIVDVRVKRIELPDDVLGSWHDRMRAGLAGVASGLRAKGMEDAEKVRAEADEKAQVILAQAYGDAERIRGDGDARAAAIYAKAYGQDPEFFRFWRSLAAYREALHDRQDVLVLEPDSEFFRYFKNAGPAGK